MTISGDDDFWQQRRDDRLVGDQAGDGRTVWERDYARVVHSAAFRRLQAKTQVFGLGDGGFYRTRLTHSMEVSQIGEGIVRRLAGSNPALPDPMLIRTVCLAHDFGHPPFGHGGEKALNFCMRNHGGFEANGQTLRILATLEHYHASFGMNLCRRSLLGVIKYPAPYSRLVEPALYRTPLVGPAPLASPEYRDAFKPPQCYLDTEQETMIPWLSTGLADWPRFTAIVAARQTGQHGKTKYRSLDAAIMDVADDIAYGVHDLEDAIGQKLVNRDMFDAALAADYFSDFCAWRGGWPYPDITASLFSPKKYQRKIMIGRIVNYLIQHVRVENLYREKFSCSLFSNQAFLLPGAARLVAFLKEFVLDTVILSEAIRSHEKNGWTIVVNLFEALVSEPALFLSGAALARFRCDMDAARQHRRVCDYIAGMTDTYAIKRHAEIFGPAVTPESRDWTGTG